MKAMPLGYRLLYSGSSVSCQPLSLALMFLSSPDLLSPLNLGTPTFVGAQTYVPGGLLVMLAKVRDRRTKGRWQDIFSCPLLHC